MDDVVLISDPKVQSIPIHENGEEVIDVRNFSEFIISNKRAGVYEGFTLLRKSVAERLKEAAKHFPNGTKIIFEEGHRPISVQKKIFDDYFSQLKANNPSWDHTKIYSECTKYIAAPTGTPPHSTGAVFDISLANEFGKELDMGSTSDDTPNENGDKNYTFSNNISEAAKQNRKMFIEIMENAGFANYPAEWWHWSYGEQYWAIVMKQDHAVYGSKEIPGMKVNLDVSYRKK